MKYLQKFDSILNYDNFVNSTEFVSPNVSIINQDNIANVKYEDDATFITAIVNITKTDEPTILIYRSLPTVVDTIIVDNNVALTITEDDQKEIYQYQFDTTGEHTIKIKFKNKYVVPFFSSIGTIYKEIFIPNMFTSIDAGVFGGYGNLESIFFGSSISNIGGGAFNGCTFKTLDLSKTKITDMNSGLVSGLSGSIENIYLPKGLTSIYQSLFAGFSKLKNVTIPASVTSIGSGAFYGCTSLTGIIFEENSQCNTIYNGAFQNVTALTEFIMPNSVTNIPSQIFGNNPNLKKLILSDNLTNPSHIYSVLSGGLSTLEELHISDAATGIFPSVSPFQGHGNISKINIPHGMTAIPQTFMPACPKLKHITIPNTIVTINSSAFAASGLEEIEFEENSTLTTISPSAFGGCTGLTQLELPASLTTLGNNSFSNCTGLISVTFNSVTAPTMTATSETSFLSYTNITSIYVPTGSVSSYQEADGFSDVASKIKAIGSDSE